MKEFSYAVPLPKSIKGTIVTLPHLEPQDLNHFEQKLEDFVNSFPPPRPRAEAAEALGVHPSAITQALDDIKQGKRDVFVRRPKKKKGGYIAISVRYFGKHKRTEEGL